jgi:SAM-dependent methyltransferase
MSTTAGHAFSTRGRSRKPFPRWLCCRAIGSSTWAAEQAGPFASRGDRRASRRTRHLARHDRTREGARRRVRASGFVVGDSERLPFPDGTFTAVLCTASFHPYPNPRRALAEIARVLTVDGRLALADGTADLRIARSHVRLYRTSELLAYLDEAGFADVGVCHLWDGGYAIALARRATQPSRPAAA